MKWFAIFSALLLLNLSAAQAEHREHGPHVHGAAQVGIAFDGTQGEITYDGPALNIYGFEHKALTEKDKTTQREGLRKLEKNIAQIIQFDPSLKCYFPEAKAFMEQDGNHSDVNGKFKISCAKSPLGTKVTVDFAKFFPTLKKVHIQLLADSVQKSVDMDHFPSEFEIK